MMPNCFQGILPMIVRRAAAGLFFLLMMMFFHISSAAGPNEEIASLLLFVEQSGCTFIRNGKQYNAPEARQHIEKKYNYFKDQITTAEEFIEYSATKSTMSGKAYRVVCNGVGLNSSDWLLAELDKLRRKNLEGDHETPDNNPDD
jgi:hypothetical protein